MTSDLTVPEAQIASFCRQHAVRELALFGSATRDDFRPDSDVDVLIDFEPTARVGLIELERMRQELHLLFKREVDLVTRNGLNPRLKDEILRSARVLYAQ